VIAFDDRGVASNPAVVERDRIAASPSRPKAYVVSVGIDQYPRLAPAYQLSYAAADARAVAAAFRAQAARGALYESIEETVLVDAQVTRSALLAALDRLSAMRPEDVAIVFLAGHGVKLDDAGEMVFLLPDASASRDALAAASVGWSAIGERLERARGRTLVLLDACHSGDVSMVSLAPNDALATSLARGGRAGVLVFAASKGSQLSYEPAGARGLVLIDDERPNFAPVGSGDHGFFTGALLASLDSTDTDADRDGNIEASELVDAVIARVELVTSGKQTPWVARRELFGDFGLASARGAAAARAP
jgi:uncharacterized caspase-like protein